MVIKYFLFVVAAWIGWASSKTTDYCKFTPEHTLCKFSGLGPRCGPKIRGSGVSPEDAAVIVAQHNKLRSLVAIGDENKGAPGPQPPAANMRSLEWDEELATLAQRHADQCVFKHDCQDCRLVDRFRVGQNLFISFQSNLDLKIQWNRAIRGWYDEVKFFPNTGVQSYQFAEETGHYTQVLWWNTSLIGCGFTMFFEDGWWKKLYTCNYGPAGNILSSQVYLLGAPCSSCPFGTSCSLEYPGLCERNDATDLDSDTSSTTILPPTPNVRDNNTILQNFSGLSGLINLNSITPNNMNLEALVEFFNNLRQKGLVTAPPTTTIDYFTPTPSTPPPQSPSANILANTDDSVDGDGALNSEFNTLNTTTTNGDSISIISVTPISLSSNISSLIFSPPQTETLTPNAASPLTLSLSDLMASLSSPTPPPIEPEAERITPSPWMMMKDSEEDTHMESNRGNEEKLTLMSILMRAGRTTKVIRTSSLDDVHKIIQDLGEGVQPIVVFRSKTGELTELDPESLTPLPSRSQRSVSNHVTSPSRLLTCEMDMSLCTINVVGGNWTVVKSPSEGSHLMIHVAEGEGTQVIVKNLINVPPSGVACVDFMHRRDTMPSDLTTTATTDDDDNDVSDPTSTTLPMLKVGVMSVGGPTSSHKTVMGVAGRWERSRSTFSDLKSEFVVMLSMSPASTASKLALDALIVTDGPC